MLLIFASDRVKFLQVVQFTPHVLINTGQPGKTQQPRSCQGDAEFPFEDVNQAFLAICETTFSRGLSLFWGCPD